MKKLLLLTAAIFSLFSVYAQSTDSSSANKLKFSDNTYLNAFSMIGFNINSNLKTSYQGVGTSFQYGKWMSPYFAMQLNTGYVFSSDINVNSLSYDFLGNLSNIIKYKEDRVFSVIPFAGISTNFYNHRSYSKYILYPGIDAGIQLHYALSSSVNLIAEGRSSLSYKFGNSTSTTKTGIANFSAVKLGVSYKFNRAKRTPSQPTIQHYIASYDVKKQQIERAELDSIKSVISNELANELSNELSNENNALKAEIAKLKDELDKQKRMYAELEAKPAEVVVSHEVTIDTIFFKSEKNMPAHADIERLKYIAQTINANPSKIYLVEGYADAATGEPSYNQTVSELRAKSVADVLTSRYNVNIDQLKVVGKGGVDNLAEKSHYNRCVIIKAD